MKKKLIILIVYLWIPIVLYSQNLFPVIHSDSSITITYEQLKNANKLFLQGEEYKLLYKESIVQKDQYIKLIDNYNKQDSIRIKDIIILQNKISKLNKKFTISKYIGTSIGLALFLILIL